MKSSPNQFRALRNLKASTEARDISISEVARSVGASREAVGLIERRPLSKYVRLFLSLLRYYDLRIVDRAGNEYFTNEKEKDHE